MRGQKNDLYLLDKRMSQYRHKTVLPQDVIFCKKCVISNQRPSATIEFENVNIKETIAFDDEGVCSACRYHEMKQTEINWQKRSEELVKLLDKHRSRGGGYDVIVPGSGGKDSTYVSHVLKYKYGMHPLTVTWPPNMYTEIGRQNFEAWLNEGFSNISFYPNRKVHRLLTREAFVNLLHPFQPFILGQKQIGPKMAALYGVKLVMYGESHAEGGTNIQEAFTPIMSPKYYSRPEVDRTNIVIGGRTTEQLLQMGLSMADLEPYLPISRETVDEKGIEVHHMGYYENWRPQDKYYYAAEVCSYKPNPDRTEGTYSKYASLDDKIDGFHYYTTYIKFGYGRATSDACQEIRNQHITREEGIALVSRYDGEFPRKYFSEFLNYLEITEDQFWEAINWFRPQHLWENKGGEWYLKHQVK